MLISPGCCRGPQNSIAGANPTGPAFPVLPVSTVGQDLQYSILPYDPTPTQAAFGVSWFAREYCAPLWIWILLVVVAYHVGRNWRG